MKHEPVSEADLHAYVDGQLPAVRLAEVESYLQAYPAEQQKVSAWRRQNADLHALFDAVVDEPVPARLSSIRGPTTAAANQPVWGWRHLAAGIAIAFVSASSGWWLRAGSDASAVLAQAEVQKNGVHGAAGFAHQAAVAHLVYSPDVRRPVEVGAEQEEQLVAWLSKRMGSPMRAPKLGKLSYELVGGRLLPGGTGPVAQFMYQDATGQRLTLYVSNDQVQNKDTGFKFLQDGKVNVFYWIDGKFGYALSGSISKAELARISNAVYEQLEKPS
ncbi:anti-sigma factor family protein [Undibacterium sp. Ji42W]|uniref:anti-sigma factor family protein n=1 Tax=Undibacterium sp. Ji42W TaxID=3413039 RepID=UPI003BEFE615